MSDSEPLTQRRLEILLNSKAYDDSSFEPSRNLIPGTETLPLKKS